MIDTSNIPRPIYFNFNQIDYTIYWRFGTGRGLFELFADETFLGSAIISPNREPALSHPIDRGKLEWIGFSNDIATLETKFLFLIKIYFVDPGKSSS